MKVLVLFLVLTVVLGARHRPGAPFPRSALLVLCCLTAATLMTYRFA